jgi:hypothetical protein
MGLQWRGLPTREDRSPPGETAARRAGCPPHHGEHRLAISRSDEATATSLLRTGGASVGPDARRCRWPCRSSWFSGVVRSVTGPVTGGRGRKPRPSRARRCLLSLLLPLNLSLSAAAGSDSPSCVGADLVFHIAPRPVSPVDRPSVAFGAHRAFAPARRPVVAWAARRSRMASATVGRLDGLLAGCGALSCGAIPGGAPHGIVPIETRTPSAQCRVLHARRCATSRAQWSP